MKTIKYYLKKYNLLKYCNYYSLTILVLVVIISLLVFNRREIILPPILNETIQVEIKGAVDNPGVYQLDKGSRIIDLIDKSGGIAVNADISVINLSRVLEDSNVVVIYTVEELNEMRKGSTSVKYIETECICPQLPTNAGCVGDVIDNNNVGKISLNNANKEQLMTLSGIGEVKAQAIIDYRTTNGQFKAIEDLMNVNGIGSSTFEKIKNNITI